MIPIEAERRLGDPASLCDDFTLINKEIGFVAQHRIEASIKSLFYLIVVIYLVQPYRFILAKSSDFLEL